jgi:hypothetical protein
MYRPQFPIPDPPAGFAWLPVIYSFDHTNTPALLLSIVSGQQTDDIPLVLDSDADFYWCATKVRAPGVELQLKDPFTNPLADDFVAAELYAAADIPTALDPPGLHCQAGATIYARFRIP